MAMQEGWTVFVDPDKKDSFRLELRRYGYNDNGEFASDPLIVVLDPARIQNALRSCNLNRLQPSRWDNVMEHVSATGKDGKEYEMCLTAEAVIQARSLQNKPCTYCGRFDCRCRYIYPQGWHYIPGDTCSHGVQTNGISAHCDRCYSGN